jgi:phosphatidate cytidylyltransferase
MARVLTAVVFLPVLLGVLWLGPPIAFAALAGAAILLGLIEYYAMTRPMSSDPMGGELPQGFAGRLPGLLAAASLIVLFYYKGLSWIPAVLAALVITELLVQLFTNRELTTALSSAAVSVFGVLYVGLLGGYIIAIRVLPEDGRLPAKLLTLFFMIVFGGDTGAYYTGRALGRHKLAPRISPGKTVEGAIGGLAGNIAAVIIARYSFFPELALVTAIPLGLIMGSLGIVGDLCESMLKRGAQVKDAGKLIPGHGGLLDRLDSMLFNAPVLYYYYLLVMK